MDTKFIFSISTDLKEQIELRSKMLQFKSVKDYLISLIEKDLKKTGIINIICEKNKTITT